jgi:deoxyribodipyrimidine photo-lyase
MWFRSDLRVSDNTAMHHACRSAQEGVIAVFAACPAQWSDHGWGSMKVNFILRNLQALSRGLSERNIPLLLIESSSFAAVPPKMLAIARRYKCGALFFNAEHEVNERRRDAIVRTLFEQVGLAVHSFTDQTILDVSRIRTGSGSWYTVFTPFKLGLFTNFASFRANPARSAA